LHVAFMMGSGPRDVVAVVAGFALAASVPLGRVLST
jgi:hypothetical protein